MRAYIFQAGKGLLRTFKAENSSVADIIPVDFTSNLIVACAWYTAVHKPQRNAQIYQITSGVLNPFTWGEMGRINVTLGVTVG